MFYLPGTIKYTGTAFQPKIAATTFSGEGIRKILLEKKKHIKGMYVLIKPTEKARYQNVVDILDEMAIADIERFAIVKITEEDKELFNQ